MKRLIFLGTAVLFMASCQKPSDKIDGTYYGTLYHGNYPPAQTSVQVDIRYDNVVDLTINSSYGIFTGEVIQLTDGTTVTMTLNEAYISHANQITHVSGYCSPDSRSIQFHYQVNINGVEGSPVIDGDFFGEM